MQQMILNDGGKGTYKEETPGMLGIWGALIKVGLSPALRSGKRLGSSPMEQQTSRFRQYMLD